MSTPRFYSRPSYATELVEQDAAGRFKIGRVLQFGGANISIDWLYRDEVIVTEPTHDAARLRAIEFARAIGGAS